MENAGEKGEENPNNGSRFAQIWPVAMVLAAGVFASMGLSLFVDSRDEEEARNAFERQADVYESILRNALANAEDELDGVAGFFAVTDDFTIDKFQRYALSSLRRHPEMQAVTWFPRVSAAERDAFEERARREVIPEYYIKDLGEDGEFSPAPARAVYFPILISVPAGRPGYKRALGFDPLSNPVRRTTFEKARDSGVRAVTERISLVTGDGNGYATAIVQPIYRSGAIIDSIEARRAALIGFVTGTFRVARLVEISLRRSAVSGLDIYLYDSDARSGEGFLAFHASRSRSAPAVREPEAELRTGMYTVRTLDVGGRTWSVIFKPAPGFFKGRSWQTIMVLAGGLLLTSLLALYQRSILAQNARVSQLVKKRTEELSKTEQRLSGVVELAQDGIISIDENRRIILFNQGAQQAFGYEPNEVLGKPIEVLLPKRFRKGHGGLVKEFGASKERTRSISDRSTIIGRRKDGEEFPAEAGISKLVIGQRKIYTVMIRDISERQAAEEMLQRSEEKFRNIFQLGPMGMVMISSEGQFLAANDEFSRITGYPEEELLERTFLDITHPDDLGADQEYIEGIAEGDLADKYVEKRYIRKNGETVWVRVTRKEVNQLDGEGRYGLGMIEDITDRRAAETISTRLGQVVEQSINEIYMFDGETLLFQQVNRGATSNLGYSTDELMQMTPLDIKPDFTLRTFERFLAPLRDGRQEKIVFETVHKRKDGSTYDVRVHLQYMGNETPPIFVAFILDITEQKRTEQQLQQAQKMEAVGQLTGGVAHDFNNLLAVILGNVEMAAERLDPDHEIRPMLELVRRAANRGAGLTQHLLAFSRQQILAPKAINLNDVLGEMTGLLGRTLGEQIEISTAPGDELWNCLADRAQTESALLNFALNARDAMPEGGKLTIETANVCLDDDYAAAQADVELGEYVMLAVSDTGTGIPPDILEHIFEPFFTTKKVGAGSGLGLSMIYGFAKQSGGHLTVYSEVGEGTTFKLYLPRSDEPVAKEVAEKALQQKRHTGELTVFVVEDDPDVRTLAVALLSDLGYQVMEAGSGPSALEAMKLGGEFDLLFTDVVLPGGMNGPQLAEKVRELRPGTPVLFMSGYTEQAIGDAGRLDAAEEFLQKPFRKKDLERKIRKILGFESG